jgi:hypothetical protein
LTLSSSHLSHVDVTNVDDATQPAHFIKERSHIVVRSGDFKLQRDFSIKVSLLLFLRLKQEKLQAGLGTKI